jgi:hypothetical protein
MSASPHSWFDGRELRSLLTMRASLPIALLAAIARAMEEDALARGVGLLAAAGVCS